MGRKILWGIFAAAALSLAVMTGGLVTWALDAPALLPWPASQEEQVTEDFLEALCGGELEAAGALLLGQPELPGYSESTNALNAVLWDYYLSGLSYSFKGDCEATQTGLVRAVEITAMDMDALLEELENRFWQLQQERQEQMAENGIFYEDQEEQALFQRQILEDCLISLLRQEREGVCRMLTLTLVYDQGQWWLQPDEALLGLLSGQFAG